jgi:hypothetical protein
MPITYRVDNARRRVVATASGILTEADVFGYQQEAWSNPELAGFDEIVDMTGVVEIVLASPASDQLRNLAATSADMDVPTSSRFAIVAPGDLAYGLGRMYGVYRDLDRRSTKQVRVFRTMDEAVAWLDDAKPGAP